MVTPNETSEKTPELLERTKNEDKIIEEVKQEEKGE